MSSFVYEHECQVCFTPMTRHHTVQVVEDDEWVTVSGCCPGCPCGVNLPEPDHEERLWWHAYGGVTELGHCLTVFGESTMPPKNVAADYPTVKGLKDAELAYLTSWDHEPTDDEKLAVTPAEYRGGPA